MMKSYGYNTRDVKTCCENKLEISFRSGKELNGWFMLEGKKAFRITVPKGRKSIPPKTYKSMANQLKLTLEEFDNLLKCDLTKMVYQEIIAERSI
ncbi:MAG: hypothetical protein ACE5GV_02700 [Candidatus Scalindua sp.]